MFTEIELIENDKNHGVGSLKFASDQIVWTSDIDNNVTYTVAYDHLIIFATTTDEKLVPRPALYCQTSIPKTEDVPMKNNTSNDTQFEEEDEEKTTTLKFVPLLSSTCVADMLEQLNVHFNDWMAAQGGPSEADVSALQMMFSMMNLPEQNNNDA